MGSANCRELRFGPYLRPRCKVGRPADCLIRGEVLVVAMSQGPLRWPIGEIDGRRELVVYGDLAKALGCESPEAIAAEWGVSLQTVAGWRRALRPGAEPQPAVPLSSSGDESWGLAPPRKYSLLDLMFWTFWGAVLSALLRLQFSHTEITDKWHIVTTCLAASLALAAAWGYGKKIRSDAGPWFRVAVVMTALFIGSLLVNRLLDVKFSTLELVAIGLGIAVTCPVGILIGSR